MALQEQQGTIHIPGAKLLLILIGKPCTNDGIDWKSIRNQGAKSVFSEGVLYFGGIDLNDRKVCQQFSPGAKLVGNARIAQCNDGPVLPAPPSSKAWTTVAEIKPFFLSQGEL